MIKMGNIKYCLRIDFLVLLIFVFLCLVFGDKLIIRLVGMEYKLVFFKFGGK